MEYSRQVMKLGQVLFELLSEALGLQTRYLNEVGCSEGLSVFERYSPSCPLVELTLGLSKHTNNEFLTVLLHDKIGGLLVLHQNQWIDVPPIPGALIVNGGDLLQVSDLGKLASKTRVEGFKIN